MDPLEIFREPAFSFNIGEIKDDVSMGQLSRMVGNVGQNSLGLDVIVQDRLVLGRLFS